MDVKSSATNRASARRNAWFAWIGAGVALTGVQMIAPSLPVMRETLGLTDGQLALVMSVYLLPGTLAAIPIGLLADRVGRRRVFGTSLVLFGLCGLALALTTSFPTFLALRFFQGLAFAGLLPLTMTILGDSYSGPALVGALGGRSVAISIGDTFPPLLGGVLASIAWWVPWLGQTVAVPLGVAVLLFMWEPPATQRPRVSILAKGKQLAELFRRLPIVALELAGFFRMFMKFGILTFLPVYLVDFRSATPAFAGLAVSLTSLAGTGLAAVSGRLARMARATTWLEVAVVVMGVAIIGVVSLPWSTAILAAATVYGAADGIVGVFTNSLVAAATGDDQRASFVSLTGAIRNLGKLLAPIALAALIALHSTYAAFVVMGIAAVASVVSVPWMRPLEEALMEEEG